MAYFRTAALAGGWLPLAVVNPRQIRAFAGATGRLAKTDALEHVPKKLLDFFDI